MRKQASFDGVGRLCEYIFIFNCTVNLSSNSVYLYCLRYDFSVSHIASAKYNNEIVNIVVLSVRKAVKQALKLK